MSLINDALKRASGTKPRPAGSDGAPLQPVQDGPRGPGALPLVLCIVGIGALLVSGAFWLKSRGTVPQVAMEKSSASPTAAPGHTAPAPQPIVVAELPRVETNTLIPPVTKVESTAAVVPTKPAAESAVVKPSQPSPENAVPPVVNPAPAPVIPAQPKPVELNLQAIYYRMRGPTVVINGKTLKVGDTVAGAKLLAIERTYVEVEVDGTRRKLTLR